MSINPSRKRLPPATVKDLLLEELRNLHIEHVCITYDGEGDEGQITHILCYDQNKNLLTSFAAGVPNDDLAAAFPNASDLPDILNTYAWDLLRQYHAGFENNDGGFGEIAIDVVGAKVTIEHNARVVDIFTEITVA